MGAAASSATRSSFLPYTFAIGAYSFLYFLLLIGLQGDVRFAVAGAFAGLVLIAAIVARMRRKSIRFPVLWALLAVCAGFALSGPSSVGMFRDPGAASEAQALMRMRSIARIVTESGDTPDVAAARIQREVFGGRGSIAEHGSNGGKQLDADWDGYHYRVAIWWDGDSRRSRQRTTAHWKSAEPARIPLFANRSPRSMTIEMDENGENVRSPSKAPDAVQ